MSEMPAVVTFLNQLMVLKSLLFLWLFTSALAADVGV